MKPLNNVRHNELWLRPWVHLLIPTVILIFGIALRIINPAPIESLTLRTFDIFQKLQPREYAPVPVRIIDLDDESLEKMGQWPWPRTQLAELIQLLNEMKPSSIVLDIVFAEKDRTSPQQILPIWQKNNLQKPLQEIEKQLVDHDQIFSEALRESPSVLGFYLKQDPNSTTPLLKNGFAYSGENPKDYLFESFGAVKNIDILEEAASGNGAFTFRAETDGIVRRVPLFYLYGNRVYPSLVSEAIRVASTATTYLIKSSGSSGSLSFGARTGIQKVKIDDFVIPTDSNGRIWLYDSGFISNRFLPAWKILDKKVDPRFIHNHIVFIGTSAAGLKDLRITPLNPVAAGVEIHAQLAEQILTQTFLTRPDWALGAEIVYLFVLGLFLILFLPRLGAKWCAFLGGSTILAILASSWYAFSVHSMLFDPIYPSILAIMIYFVSTSLNFLRTEQERGHFRNAFSRYLSPTLVENLSRNPNQLKLGGETREMTVLFADIKNFTTISEQLTAAELTRFMNLFLTPMTDIILKHSGTIDKYMGDCIMAFWNAPLDDPDHARHASQVALKMQHYLTKWNKDQQALHHEQPWSAIELGIGINTGVCCVGNFGSEQRFDYSVIGDDVNLASRLEGQSKYFGLNIVMGPQTYEKVCDFASIEIDLIQVKGKTKPVKIYTVLGEPLLNDHPRFQILKKMHREFLSSYRSQQWELAHRLLSRCKNHGVGKISLEKLYSIYEQRIEHYRLHSPGVHWTGVFEADFK